MMMLSRTAACVAAKRSLVLASSSLVINRSQQRIGSSSNGVEAVIVSQTPCFPGHPYGVNASEQCRAFSSKPQRNSGKSNNNEVIMNEQLIQVLMRRYDAAAGDLIVRLVVDEGPSQPSSIEVVSLLKAMETARDLDVDLIGINLKQEPPVVKAEDYAKLAYKASSKKQSKAEKKATKEFKFRSGIAENDFDRKMNDVVRYLKKGHNCQLSMTANGFNTRTNPGGLNNLISKILEQVGDSGVCEKGVQSNEEGNRAFLLLRPNNNQKN